MQDDGKLDIDTSLTGLTIEKWKDQLCAVADELGNYQPLGDRHFATFIDDKTTLLVTFETIQGIRALSDKAQPFGFELVKSHGWSHLCIISDGDTWFRDHRIYGYFDRLIDDGFFEDFEQVLFYGAGPCGYAAAAFSVAAPGATVIAVRPQATLDPRVTEWDPRFRKMRRTSFTDRYGYAPDMMDAAKQGFVLYDSRDKLDAMHSALFKSPNVSRIRAPHMGNALNAGLIEMQILPQILSLAGQNELTEQAFFKLYRARRDHLPYLRNLMTCLDAEDRPFLNALLCRNVTSRMVAPRFERRLEALEKQVEAGDFKLPARKA